MTGRPAARIDLALASTARVADSLIARTRADSPLVCVLMMGILSSWQEEVRFDAMAPAT